MPRVSATHAKQNFAAIIDQAQREPVHIRRHDRDVAVILSAEQYERFRQLRVQELLRVTREMSREAESKGMTDEILAEILAGR